MTQVINKIAPPGGIKHIEIHPDSVQVRLHDGATVNYTKISETSARYPVRRDGNGQQQ